MSIIPNISPKLFSLSAVAVGYILIDDMTANEQNALGNWLMLTAQVLCTNAYYKQVQNERGISSDKSNLNNFDTVNIMKKMVKAMKDEINNLENT